MRTYTHGAIGWLLYQKKTKTEQKRAAIGAMIPDLFLAIGFIFHFLGDSAIVSFLHNLFHHSWLHTVTIMMHSFLIVVPLLLVSYLWYKQAIPLFVGMLSHVVIDLLTHQRAAYNHFYPLDFAPLRGPLSYTSFGFSIIEHLAFAAFVVYLYKKGYLNQLLQWVRFRSSKPLTQTSISE